MINNIAKCLYKLLPTRFLTWKSNSDKYDKHILYCEKLIILILLFILYNLIIVTFVFLQWKKCTNIIDLIHNKIIDDTKYSNKFFKRDDDFCNITDGFFITYIAFLVITLILNVIFGIFYEYYRKYKNYTFKKDKNNFDDKIIIHIPLYNEDEDIIKSTIESILNVNYNIDNLLLLIVIDGIIMNKQKLKTTDYILLNNIFNNDEYMNDKLNDSVYENTINYKDNNLKIYTGLYKEINYSVVVKCGNEFEEKRGNRGKKDSALIIYETIEFLCNGFFKEYDETFTPIIEKFQQSLTSKSQNIVDYDYMLILDCDTDIEFNGLLNLLNYIKNNTKCIAVCGQTIVKNKYESLITMIQSFEYFVSHLLLKTFEHILYNIFVLSGCFTLIKLKHNEKPTINQNIIAKYTAEGNTLYEKNLLEIGEDRHLTCLILQEHPDNDISYISDAECFTCVPTTFKVLIDQRRRWTNSLITCLFLLLLEPPKQSLFRHFKMYLIIIMEMFIIFVLPLVILIGIINSVISLTLQGFSLIPLAITLIIIFLNLIIVTLVCKFSMILKFIPFFFFLPVFSIIIPWYSILNIDDLKWGLSRDNDDTIVNANDDNIIITPNNSYISINSPFANNERLTNDISPTNDSATSVTL